MRVERINAGLTGAPAVSEVSPQTATPAYQAFQILHWGFVVLPLVAGFDKFFHLLAHWHEYLAPVFPSLLNVSAHTFMYGVGVIEIAAGLLAAFKPKWAGYIIAFWLWGIIINLFVLGAYYDIALRDFGLSLGALALARLAHHFDRPAEPAAD